MLQAGSWCWSAPDHAAWHAQALPSAPHHAAKSTAIACAAAPFGRLAASLCIQQADSCINCHAGGAPVLGAAGVCHAAGPWHFVLLVALQQAEGTSNHQHNCTATDSTSLHKYVRKDKQHDAPQTVWCPALGPGAVNWTVRAACMPAASHLHTVCADTKCAARQCAAAVSDAEHSWVQNYLPTARRGTAPSDPSTLYCWSPPGGRNCCCASNLRAGAECPAGCMLWSCEL